VVTAESSADSTVSRLVIEPNRSLTWSQSLAFFVGTSVVSLAIAVTFALKGYWVIFPFTGLELLALGTAIYYVSAAACRCQVISIGERIVRIEKGRLRRTGASRGGPETQHDFDRPWTRVEVDQQRQPRPTLRIWVGASGRRVEVGEFLTDLEKRRLADELRRRIALDSRINSLGENRE
jgi:uncharacterized membrane protein